MIYPEEISNNVELVDQKIRRLIRSGEIRYAGNRRLKIYGTLKCKSGKRMKKENRVFFTSIEEAEKEGYRPCGHCRKEEYKKWKQGK